MSSSTSQRKGITLANFDRVACWNDFMGAQTSKHSKVQPFWWFGDAGGSAFGLVLEVQWNTCLLYTSDAADDM
eukprot:2913453-Karenia_brevis.AAC.1